MHHVIKVIEQIKSLIITSLSSIFFYKPFEYQEAVEPIGIKLFLFLLQALNIYNFSYSYKSTMILPCCSFSIIYFIYALFSATALWSAGHVELETGS